MNVHTCADALLNAGDCCEPGCDDPAVVVILTDPDPLGDVLVEHARCLAHVSDAIASKPLAWDPVWEPKR